MNLESNMLGRNTQSTSVIAYNFFIQYKWTGLGDYIVELFWNDNINKDISTYIWQYIWREQHMNVNKKYQHPPSRNHINGNNQITETNSLGPQQNLQTYPPTRMQIKYTKCGGKISLLFKSSQPHHAGIIGHISGSTIKRNRIHQINGGTFN